MADGHTREAYSPDYYDEIGRLSERSAAVVVPIVLEYLLPESVIDVGCGEAAWASQFLQCGVADVCGIDGDYVMRNRLKIPSSCFIAHDLSEPFQLTRTFDLAVSLEVAEHLPSDRADTFVTTLTRLAPVVVFSAAVPNQGGKNHLNERWPAYWAGLFSNHGYAIADCIRSRVWDDVNVAPWYAQNTFLYVDKRVLSVYPHLEAAVVATAGRAVSMVHPEMFRNSLVAYHLQQAETMPLRHLLRAIGPAIARTVRRRGHQ